MSNAGIYGNKHLTTSIEVLNIYSKFAQNHPNIMFYLLCNDWDKKRIDNMNHIYSLYEEEFEKYEIKNIKCICSNEEASIFINNLSKKFEKVYSNMSMRSILLYVDPYNLISYNLANSVHNFVKNVYCEMILNYDIQDYIRNINNDTNIKYETQLREFTYKFCELDYRVVDATAVMNETIRRIMTDTNLKFKYGFLMRNNKNALLYELVYFTPSLKGLEKIKEATWKVFGFHNSYSSSHRDRMQLDLFGKNDETYAYDDSKRIVRDICLASNKSEFTYKELLIISLEHTIFLKGKVISNIIKPLIDDKVIIKQNLKGSKNFTEDLFEAIVGAVAIDCNWDMDTITDVVEAMIDIESYFENYDDTDDNYVGELQEWMQQNKLGLPNYKYEENDDSFECFLNINGINGFTGKGQSKAQARRECAANAYNYLKENNYISNEYIEAVGDADSEQALRQLNELKQKELISEPKWEEELSYDKNGNPIWRVRVTIPKLDYCFVEENSSKKEAKRLCAYDLLCELMYEDD